jgi:hypothetical protein
VVQVAALAKSVALAGSFVGPLLYLGDPSLVLGTQSVPQRLNVRVVDHGLNPQPLVESTEFVPAALDLAPLELLALLVLCDQRASGFDPGNQTDAH